MTNKELPLADMGPMNPPRHTGSKNMTSRFDIRKAGAIIEKQAAETTRLRADRETVIRECAYIAAINGDPAIEEAILALIETTPEQP